MLDVFFHCQPRVDKKINAFASRVKRMLKKDTCVRVACVPNCKRICCTCETRMLGVWNALALRATRVCLIPCVWRVLYVPPTCLVATCMRNLLSCVKKDDTGTCTCSTCHIFNYRHFYIYCCCWLGLSNHIHVYPIEGILVVPASWQKSCRRFDHLL